jgi:preprotein translocase subunit SecB
MSEQTTANSADNNAAIFQIQRVYLKDVSLEQPNAPQILLTAGEPEIQIQLDIQFGQLQDGIFEVTVIGSVTTRLEDKVLFLVEAQQSGIFELRNIPQEQIEPMLAIACPTILYPYLRSNIADLISRAGFQPVHLAEVNFHALYEQRLAQAQAGQVAQAASDNGSGINLPN